MQSVGRLHDSMNGPQKFEDIRLSRWKVALNRGLGVLTGRRGAPPHLVAERLRRERFEAEVGLRVADQEPCVGDLAIGPADRAFEVGTRFDLDPARTVD